ncbi:MAG: CRISPR-associated helicase Cas3' [Rhodospirillaceae bacterium]|nr:CRISPR-associated helicase Cas3' [Rhodospirillaceae bacterium]
MVDMFDWPGKSDKDGNKHPAVLHMLDVGSCAERLIAGHTVFRRLSNAQRQALVVLVALHDVGKLSESFRALIRNNETGHPPHWQLSDHLLCGVLDEVLMELGADDWVRAELYAAVAGHHGRPPRRAGGDRAERRKRQRAVGSGEKAARAWVWRLLKLFPDASLEDMAVEDARALSWALSGLTVASDWVGSNMEWFPFEPDQRDIEVALAESQCRAARAVNEAGLDPPPPAPGDGAALIKLTELRPMQEAVSTVTLGDGPRLAVIEDSTGTGKTEAALILAHRMIAAGMARGLFFALPTMATSDAMFERMQDVAPALFEGPPSVVLTHSRAKLSAAMRELRGTPSDETPETDNAEWLADNRRRSLLATVGVGTVDQALLGVLPTRFSTLRLFGLADKVLIVDEAHSYDPYMQRELEALLRMQARLGGSAILMTATLPLAMRQAYIRAFQEGLSARAHDVSATHYPGLHLVGREVSSHAVTPLAGNVRTVRVERLGETDRAVDLLANAAAAGAACVWVRNAVDDAIEAVETLTRRGVKADLLHARFAVVDRLRQERMLMGRFGKEGSGRAGRILVATQVVEASLDLDFDVMISDLAPIGSLIQRTGRLWRHMENRPAAGRPVAAPVLHVVSPDPDRVEGDDWLRTVLGGGAWVYRLDHQWLTARALFDAGEIAAPDGLRALIEAVHGDDAPTVPKVLGEAEGRADGDAMASAAMARSNVVDGSAGYLTGTRGAVGNDALFPTRLGEPQVIIVLARRCGSQLASWADTDDPALAWALSEVSASRRRFAPLLPDQDTPEVRTVTETWPEWRRDACSVGVVEEDGAIGDRLLYDKDHGLQARSPSRRG